MSSRWQGGHRGEVCIAGGRDVRSRVGVALDELPWGEIYIQSNYVPSWGEAVVVDVSYSFVRSLLVFLLNFGRAPPLSFSRCGFLV